MSICQSQQNVFLRPAGIAAVEWSVELPSSPICAVIGSTVVIPCSYNFPQTLSQPKGDGLLAQVIE